MTILLASNKLVLLSIRYFQVRKIIRDIVNPYVNTSVIKSLLKIFSLVLLGFSLIISSVAVSNDSATSCKPSVTTFIHNN